MRPVFSFVGSFFFVWVLFATSADSLRQSLQWMDSLGVLGVWVLVALLPPAAGLPSLVGWLGWIYGPGDRLS